MNKLKIEYVPISELNAYVNNAKEHPAEQVEQIKKSILEFGMNDPIAVWKDNVIIEGHGRLLALSELGDEYSTVPIIRLDHLSDEQRRAYALVHNKLTMNSDFNLDVLNMELEDLADFDIDMTDFGFSFPDEELEDEIERQSAYSKNAKIPQYEPTGLNVTTQDLVDTDKTHELIMEIEEAGIDEATKQFLMEAAHRHSVFNYRNIAEFYANADPVVQRLMERSALVIIDINDAIANGFVKLSKTIEDIIDEEDGDA